MLLLKNIIKDSLNENEYVRVFGKNLFSKTLKFADAIKEEMQIPKKYWHYYSDCEVLNTSKTSDEIYQSIFNIEIKIPQWIMLRKNCYFKRVNGFSVYKIQNTNKIGVTLLGAIKENKDSTEYKFKKYYLSWEKFNSLEKDNNVTEEEIGIFYKKR